MRLPVSVLMTCLFAGSGLSAKSDLPKGCSQTDIEKYGRPVMFERRHGIAFGVSTPTPEFPASAHPTVYIWLSNESRVNQGYSMCCNLTFLKRIRVFNSSGVALETQVQKKLREQGRSSDDIFHAPCSCSSIGIVVKPRSCQVVDQGTINFKGLFDLTPGDYMIRENVQNGPGPLLPSGTTKGNGFKITVKEP
jgi:hypothetical protein